MSEELTEKFSYSKLSTYKECPFKYKLEYVDGLRSHTDSIATEFGSLIHEIEESIANRIISQEDINYEELIEHFNSEFSRILEKYPKEATELDKSGRTYEEKGKYYTTTAIYSLENYMKQNPFCDIVGVEQEFSFEFSGYIFHGFIDRVFFDRLRNVYIIQDIKTYPVEMKSDKLSYPLQFIVYVMAAKELYHIPSYRCMVCEYYLPLCNKTQEARMSDINKYEDKINAVLKKIESKNFEPNPTPLCHWCEFCQTNDSAPEDMKFACPYFCHWTREHKTFAVENLWMGIGSHPAILERYQKEYQKKGGN